MEGFPEEVVHELNLQDQSKGAKKIGLQSAFQAKARLRREHDMLAELQVWLETRTVVFKV